MPYEQDMRKVRMQQMLAQMLQQQGQQGMQGTQAGGRYMAPSRNASIAGALSQIGGGLLGGYGMRKEGELEDQRKADLAAQIAKMAEIESMPSSAQPAAPAPSQQPVTGFQPPPQREAIPGGGQQQGNPRNQRLAAALQAIGELPVEEQQQILSSQAMQQLFPKYRDPEKPVAVIGADGKPVYAKESEAYGKQPYSMVSAAQPSADIQSYEIAKTQGYTGTLLDFLKERASATAQPNYSMQDVAGARGPMNARTGEFDPISTLPEEAAAKAALAGAEAGAKTTATAQAERTAAFPKQLAGIQKMRNNIQGLLDDPGFNTIYGKSRYVSPSMLPGEKGAGADARRAQLEAQTFGESIQDMRGLGALSNAEGLKVSSAYTRATNPNISEEDARVAWDEVIDGLTLAEERLRAGVKVSDDNKSPVAGANGEGLPQISSDEEFDALPSGAEFLDPDGKRRRKP